MKLPKTLIIAIMISTFLLPVKSFGINLDAPSDWATDSISQAITIGLVPEDLQCEYQKDITRAEFTKMAIYFLAAQYNYQDFFSNGTVSESSVEDFICYFLDKCQNDGNPVYQKNEYWTFLPEELREKEEKILGRTADDYNWRGLLNTMNPFLESDDPSCFKYKLYINAAYVLHIITGYDDGTFRPDSPITRQEAATMLLRTYQVYNKQKLLNDNSKMTVNYSDADLIGPWAKEAVALMSNYHVMNGTDTTTFSPDSHYTREQCMVTFFRLYINMPTSKVQNNVARFSTIEEDVDLEVSSAFFHLSYRWDTDYAIILYGTYGGIGTLRGSKMHIFYFAGGKRSLNLSGNSFSLSEDQQYILYKSGEISYRIDIETAQIQQI